MPDWQAIIAQENAGSLESAAAAYKPAWVWLRLLRAVGLLVGAIVAVVALLACLALLYPDDHSRTRRVGLSSEHLFWLVVTFLAGAAAILLAASVYEVWRAVRGPLAAQTSPSATATLYYKAMLSGSRRVSEREAFLFLLDHAKVGAGDAAAFTSHWRHVRGRLHTIAKKYAQGLSRATRTLYSIKASAGVPTIVEQRLSKVTMRVTVTATNSKSGWVDPLGGTLSRIAGTAEFHAECLLAEVGGRWYVADPQWRARLVSNPPPGWMGTNCLQCDYPLESVAALPDAPRWVICPECGLTAPRPAGFTGRAPGAPAPELPARPLNLDPPSPLLKRETLIEPPKDEDRA